ncbi:orotate phosphoribosyltransferase [Parelusimicrobium proximum]|uniref:orotate phosphoribosyltransferase n=1 Tax=Parelusimicrobium proximum TaxID=3228953 RepID=UPI003D1708DA
MTNEEVLDIFKKCGALLEGHFKLSSGLHSGKYLQCAKVLQYPDVAGKLCRELAQKMKEHKIDVVVGPAMGGVVIGYEMARALGVRGIFTERVDGEVQIRRGFEIKEGERCLISEDVVTTGKSTREVMELIKKHGGKVEAVCSLIDRSGGEANLGVPLFSMAKVEVQTYTEDECPMCQQGEPVVKPGSRV